MKIHPLSIVASFVNSAVSAFGFLEEVFLALLDFRIFRETEMKLKLLYTELTQPGTCDMFQSVSIARTSQGIHLHRNLLRKTARLRAPLEGVEKKMEPGT